MALGSAYFQTYHQSLQRVQMTEMLDEHRQAQTKRRLSIVGPCYTHEQWLAVHEERLRNDARRAAAAHSATAEAEPTT